MPASLEATTPAHDAFAAMRGLILVDSALQRDLGGIEDFATFAAQAARTAQAAGVDLDGETIRAHLHAPAAPPPVIFDQRPLPGWLPTEVTRVDGRQVITWAWFGRRRLTESFYADDLTRARRLPFNRFMSFRTPLDHLPAWAAALPTLRPTGLIFHMSRCGSTLATQMLAASPADIAVSEAAPLDAIVQLKDHDEAAKVVLLRVMAAVLGQVRNPGETRAVFKLDCWHSRDLPLFRRAFPDTPWVFLYRDPVEVMVSHMRRRGMQMTPSLVSPAIFGIDLPSGVPDDDYCARVLAAICEGAVRHYPDGGGRLVNYRQMPEALLDVILPHFGVEVSATEAAAMRATTARDAKTPEQAFTPDAQAKQDAATQGLRDLCERRLGAVYTQLETFRAAQA